MPREKPEQTGDQITVGNIANAQAIAIGAGATAIYQGLTIAEVAALVAELKRVDRPMVWDGRIPYIGLSAFQESDAQFFFGRESLIDDLLQRVTTANFITIAGPSGSGKSSVARAGLFHVLRNSRLEKSDAWLLTSMTPGNNPIEHLATAVVRAAKTPGAGDHIRQKGLENQLALYEQIEALLSDDPRQRFVILVDQFEELFTQTKSDVVRTAFIHLLTTASQAPGSRAIILLALRSDFISHCARFPDLRSLMSQQFQLVGAMEAHDLAKAITLPALEVGAEIDPALVSRIMADMKGEPGALPLMSFALRDLFEAEKTEKGQPMDLTLPEYLQRGGIESALERHANQVFANFSDEQKELAKTIFSRLIEIGQGRQDTRRTAVFTELIPAGKDAEAVATVIDSLAREGSRLLTTSGSHDNEIDTPAETTITIAHEKLIDAWPWLRQLVDENREAIALQNQIASDAQAWAQDKDAGYLYRGGRLLRVEEQLAELDSSLNELSQQFIQTSLKERQREIDEKEAQERQKLEQERALAEAQRQRAEEEHRRAEEAEQAAAKQSRLTRIAFVVGGIALVLFIVAGIAGLAARNSEMEAVAAQETAEFNANLAVTREMEAIAARGTAVHNEQLAVTREAEAQQLNHTIRASQLALAVQLELANPEDRSGSLALLLAREAVLTTWEVEQTILPVADAALRAAVDAAPPHRMTLTGHADGVNAAAYSPDSQFVVTASSDETARIWDATTGETIRILNGHTAGVNSATYSPDGQFILTASSDETARIWDTASGQVISVLTGHSDWVNTAFYSPDGQFIVTASNDGTARIWQTATGETIHILTNPTGSVIYSAIYSPDGQFIVTTGMGDATLLWQVATGEAISQLDADNQHGYAAAYSPDGESIVIASNNQNAHIRHAETGHEIRALAGHQAFIPPGGGISIRSVTSVAYSPDGRFVATAGEDGTARIWNVTNGQEEFVLTGHQTYVESVAYSPDGKSIITGSSDGIARIWDVWPIKMTRVLGVPSLFPRTRRAIQSAVYSSDDQFILLAHTHGAAEIWNTATGQKEQAFSTSEQRVVLALYSPDNQFLATLSGYNSVQLWDVALGQEVYRLDTVAYGAINSVSYTPDNQFIITAGTDGVHIWEMTTGNIVDELTTKETTFASYSPNGQLVVTIHPGGEMKLWQAATKEPIHVLRSHSETVSSAVFSPNSQFIVTAGNDQVARIWYVDSGRLIHTLRGHSDGVNTAVYSPDGQFIVTASQDQTARIWDASTGETIRILSGHNDKVNSAVYSSDGRFIVTGSEDQTARIWLAHIDDLLSEAASLIQRTPPQLTTAERQQFNLE